MRKGAIGEDEACLAQMKTTIIEIMATNCSLSDASSHSESLALILQFRSVLAGAGADFHFYFLFLTSHFKFAKSCLSWQ